MNRNLMDKWCERGILGMVLAILVYGPLATGAVHTPDFLVIQGLTMGAMLLWLLRLWLNPQPKLFWPPICWVAVVFAAYAVARYYTAEIEYAARMEMVRVLIYVILFLVVLNNLHHQEFTTFVVLTIVFLAMFISLYAVYQFIANSDQVWFFTKPYSHRGSGTYISPNNLAGFLEMVLPLGLAWVLVSRAKPVLKVFVGYASFVLIAGIAVTVSRGSWISVSLVLVVLFAILLFDRAYRLPSSVLLVVIVGAGLYFVPRTQFFQLRLKQLTENDRINDSARFELWRPAVQLWLENPCWGIGPDHFNYRFRKYRPETVQLEADRVHNDYLNTLVDWGIAGAALVVAAWLLLGVGAARTWRSLRASQADLGGRKSNKIALVMGASLGLLAILFHSVVDFNMHVPANAITAVTLMALLTGCLRYVSQAHWFKASASTRLVVTLVLVVCMSYLGWQGVTRAREYVHLRRAQHTPAYSTERIAELEKAFALDKMNFETAYAIGEAFRMQSWEGGQDYAELAEKALQWFAQAIRINPYHSFSFVRCGMCMDWMDRCGEARPFFEQAVQLDPNGYFTVAHMGWHCLQAGDLAAARAWFERSRRLQSKDNPIADSYFQIVNRRLLESATNGLAEGNLAQ